MNVDVHAHFYPQPYLDRLSELAGRKINSPADGPRLPFDERADVNKEAGVDVQVISLGSMMQHLPHVDHALSATRIANDIYGKIISDFSGRFAAFGAVPLPNVDEALKEASRCLDELGMSGITIGCTVGDRSPEDPAFDAFWAEMNRRKTAVFLHPVARAAEFLLKDYGLVPMIGACLEDSLAALRLSLSGLTKRYPDVKIIVPHLGGAMTMAYYRLERRDAHGALKEFYYDTATGCGPALRCACDILGSDRIMMGTDDGGAGTIRQQVDYIAKAGLSAGETKAIMGGTAAELLGLGVPA